MSTEWQQVLWREQPFPDNYVPPSFLSSLQRNREHGILRRKTWSDAFHAANFKPYTYASLVFGACAICQHISTIFAFLAVFVHMQKGDLDPRLLVWTSGGCFVAGYLAWELLECCVEGRASGNRT
jgi:phosphatidylinositol glycan class C protein